MFWAGIAFKTKKLSVSNDRSEGQEQTRWLQQAMDDFKNGWAIRTHRNMVWWNKKKDAMASLFDTYSCICPVTAELCQAWWKVNELAAILKDFLFSYLFTGHNWYLV